MSTRRVTELVELGTFKRFDFLGRTYVSLREVLARRHADVKGGRPKRGKVQRLKLAVKTVLKNDSAQWFQGGPVTSKERIEEAKKAGKKRK